MTLKQKIYNQYQKLLEEKIKTLRDMIADLAEDAQNDAKGSAGDKHETALAMMHLEQEKLNQKLKEIITQKSILDSIDITTKNNKVGLGSLVFTDNFIFFISSALPRIIIDNKEIIALSLHSPLGMNLKAKAVGDEIQINSIKNSIIKIE